MPQNFLEIFSDTKTPRKLLESMRGRSVVHRTPWWVVGPTGTPLTYLRLYKYSKIPKNLGESTKYFFRRRKF